MSIGCGILRCSMMILSLVSISSSFWSCCSAFWIWAVSPRPLCRAFSSSTSSSTCSCSQPQPGEIGPAKLGRIWREARVRKIITRACASLVLFASALTKRWFNAHATAATCSVYAAKFPVWPLGDRFSVHAHVYFSYFFVTKMKFSLVWNCTTEQRKARQPTEEIDRGVDVFVFKDNGVRVFAYHRALVGNPIVSFVGSSAVLWVSYFLQVFVFWVLK